MAHLKKSKLDFRKQFEENDFARTLIEILLPFCNEQNKINSQFIHIYDKNSRWKI